MQKTKTEFKQTEIGEIPKDWDVVRLGDVCRDMFYGITAKATSKDTGIQMLRTTDIVNYSVEWKSLPFCEITDNRKDLSKYFIQKGDILVARAGTVGISVIADTDKNNVIFGSYLIGIRLENGVYSKYVHYLLQSDLYWSQLRVAQGSTLKNINLPTLKSIIIPLPPLPEQKAIAKVLSTVDEAIQLADQAIEKSERLKKGFMQKLLTKGIEHTEFKQTEIGEIPKDWDVVRLGDVCEKIKSGGTPLVSVADYYGGGIPFVKIEDITNAQKYIYSTNSTITNRGLKESNAWLVPPNSLLIAIYGSLGKVAINKVTLATNQAILGVIPKMDKLDTEFAYYLLSKYKLSKYAKRSTQANLTKAIIENVLIPLPPLPEQKKIAEILSTIDRKIELEKERKEKLERIKKGLMQVLLTGRKRLDVEKVLGGAE